MRWSNQLPSKDLNNVITIGYYGASTNTALTLSNCPTQSAFVMEVFPFYSTTTFAQRITDYSGSVYERVMQDATTWSTWKSL